MQDLNIQALDAVVFVKLDIRSSNLSNKTDREDLPKGKQMPPNELYSSGETHYANPKLKNPFLALKKRAERLCVESGFRIEGNFAIPFDKMRALNDELRKLQTKWYDEVQVLRGKLPQEYKDWEASHPGWEDMLRRNRPDPDGLANRYRFEHRLWQIRPAPVDATSPLNSAGISHGSLLEAILDDVAREARQILKDSFEGKSQVNGRVMSTIGVLGKKLKSFAGVDPLVRPVAAHIGNVLGQIGRSAKKLSVSDTMSLRGLLTLMTDPVKLRREGELLRVENTGSIVTSDQTEITFDNHEVEVDVPPQVRESSQPARSILF